MPAVERVTARTVQFLFYAFMFGLAVSGYLVPTARGRGLDFFGLFEVPALVWGLAHQEDIAGDVHRVLAYVLMGLVLVHTLGALKHHFIDRDETLLRMLFIGKKR
jgi:cytochrome b561